jgi:hypothetical protein
MSEIKQNCEFIDTMKSGLGIMLKPAAAQERFWYWTLFPSKVSE